VLPSCLPALRERFCPFFCEESPLSQVKAYKVSLCTRAFFMFPGTHYDESLTAGEETSPIPGAPLSSPPLSISQWPLIDPSARAVNVPLQIRRDDSFTSRGFANLLSRPPLFFAANLPPRSQFQSFSPGIVRRTPRMPDRLAFLLFRVSSPLNPGWHLSFAVWDGDLPLQKRISVAFDIVRPFFA